MDRPGDELAGRNNHTPAALFRAGLNRFGNGFRAIRFSIPYGAKISDDKIAPGKLRLPDAFQDL